MRAVAAIDEDTRRKNKRLPLVHIADLTLPKRHVMYRSQNGLGLPLATAHTANRVGAQRRLYQQLVSTAERDSFIQYSRTN